MYYWLASLYYDGNIVFLLHCIFSEHFKCCKYVLLTMNFTYLLTSSVAEVEWCSSGDVGNSADADVHDAVCQWLWKWWRPPSIHQVWQVQQCWAPSVHHAGVSMLVLASDTDWLAAVANQSVAQTPDQAAHWAWVYTRIYIFSLPLSLSVLTAIFQVNPG